MREGQTVIEKYGERLKSTDKSWGVFDNNLRKLYSFAGAGLTWIWNFFEIQFSMGHIK